jgi:uncharacterized alkaline shock family protein YloU
MSEMFHYDAGDLGKVEIAPEVIQTIAGLAATEVEGVLSLTGGVVGDLNILGRKNPRKGIRVELGEQLVIELSVIVQYGYHIPDVGRTIQEKVKAAVENMTGLVVDRIIVRVEGVKMGAAEKGPETDARVR